MEIACKEGVHAVWEELEDISVLWNERTIEKWIW